MCQGRLVLVNKGLKDQTTKLREPRLGSFGQGVGGRLSLSSLVFGDGGGHLSTGLSCLRYEVSDDAKILA